MAGTHLNVDAILSKLDKHDKALQHALCALELIKSRVDALGDATSQAGSPKSLEIGEDEYSVLAIAYHNVAVERDYLQQLEEAYAAYQQGHEVAKKCLGDQHPLTQTLAKNANAVGNPSEVERLSGASEVAGEGSGRALDEMTRCAGRARPTPGARTESRGSVRECFKAVPSGKVMAGLRRNGFLKGEKALRSVAPHARCRAMSQLYCGLTFRQQSK